MKLTPLSEHIGVEITDVQMAHLAGDDLESLKQAVFENGVAVLRDQELSPDQHIAFAKRWGGIDVNPFFPTNSDWPEIAEVRKAETQRDNIGGGWHTDHSYDEIPAMGSILVARTLPPSGGDTLLSSMGAAYDSLSDGLKATLGTLRAVHSSDHIFRSGGAYSKTDMADELTGQELSTRAVHPVIIRHPITGRKTLYVNPGFTLHFEGWTREESLPLLRYLYEVGQREEFRCRVHWRPGSVAIWDNRATWHFAMNDYHGHARVLHRITLTGDPLAA